MLTRSINAVDGTFLELHQKLVEEYPSLGPLSEVRRYQKTVHLLAKYCPCGGKVADIGAWPGALTACLAMMGWQVVAVDKHSERPAAYNNSILLNEAAFAIIGENASSLERLCSRLGVPIESLDIEITPMPFESGSMDAVIFTEIIEHLSQDPLFALSEINRILKVGGILILSTPNLMSLRNRINFLLGRIERVIENPFVSFLKGKRLGHMGHLRLYAPKELQMMLHMLGFHCALDFTRFEDLDFERLTKSGRTSVSLAESSKKIKRQTSSLRGRLIRTFIRSPRSYWAAGCATVLKLAEELVPHFRPQMFISARKIKNADFDQNYATSLKELVARNDFSL